MNLFDSVKQTAPGRNRFDLSHDVKLSCNMGYLVPTLALECIPGDKHQIGCESLLRFAPLISPVMHRMNVSMHYFFVPNRLLWAGWSDFITNTPTGGVLPAVPTLTMSGASWVSGGLSDYLGIPEPLLGNTEAVSALPFAAYQLIWNEYYRDQNLQPSIFTLLEDGSNDVDNDKWTTLRKRAWEHDYFTGALPFAQKGAAVTIPLGEMNDVNVYRNSTPIPGTNDVTSSPDHITIHNNASNDTDIPVGELFAQTSQLVETASTINDLRRAYKLQEWLEKAARGGSRLVENIRSFFGIKPQDARLQRPEYITGTKSPVIISEVLNTTGTDDNPQGNMAGHGVSVTAGKNGSYFCQEHGYIIGIMSVLPTTAYQQGIDRHWLKTDPFSYYWPQFAHIGEQEVQNREVYAYQGTDGLETFGYVPRYAEYKFMQNRVAGDFRGNLSFWHMGRIFSAPPALNAQFIQADPTDRIFAVIDPDVQKLYVTVFHRIGSSRLMPIFGTPTW